MIAFNLQCFSIKFRHFSFNKSTEFCYGGTDFGSHCIQKALHNVNNTVENAAAEAEL